MIGSRTQNSLIQNISLKSFDGGHGALHTIRKRYYYNHCLRGETLKKLLFNPEIVDSALDCG